MGEFPQPRVSAYHGADASGDPPSLGETDWTVSPSGLVGRVIDGRYRVERVLGEGGMAVVLEAVHIHLDKPVALKVLHPELQGLQEIRGRFMREARAASRVDHEAVVAVSDFGVSEEGLHYLVMERLEGSDLWTWASRYAPLPPRVVAAMAKTLAEALDAIHRAGFVHRDVKTENVFVLDGDAAWDGVTPPRVKVLDLGIAAVDASRGVKDEPRLTRAGQTLGTVQTMAPEQVSGKPLDGRTDLYALGCVLFELLTGEPLFSAETSTEVMMCHLRERARRPSEVVDGIPPWLDAIVLRCLEKNPGQRFASAEELASALGEGLEQGDAVFVEPGGEEARAPAAVDATEAAIGGPSEVSRAATETTTPPSRGSRGAWIGSAALALGAVALVVGLASPGAGGGAATPSRTPPTDEAVTPAAGGVEAVVMPREVERDEGSDGDPVAAPSAPVDAPEGPSPGAHLPEVEATGTTAPPPSEPSPAPAEVAPSAGRGADAVRSGGRTPRRPPVSKTPATPTGDERARPRVGEDKPSPGGSELWRPRPPQSRED